MMPSSTQSSKGHFGIIHNSPHNPDIRSANSMNPPLKHDSLPPSLSNPPPSCHVIQLFFNFPTSNLNSPRSILPTARIIVLKHKPNHRFALLRTPQYSPFPTRSTFALRDMDAVYFSTSLLILYHKQPPCSMHGKLYTGISETTRLKGSLSFSQAQIHSSARILCLRNVITRQKTDSHI